MGPALWRSRLTPKPEALASHMGTGSRPGCSTSDPALCYGLGKQYKMAQVLGPLHPCGDPEEVPRSWLQINAALAIVAIWGVNQQLKDLSLSLSLSLSLPLPLPLCNSAYQLNEYIF